MVIRKGKKGIHLVHNSNNSKFKEAQTMVSSSALRIHRGLDELKEEMK